MLLGLHLSNLFLVFIKYFQDNINDFPGGGGGLCEGSIGLKWVKYQVVKELFKATVKTLEKGQWTFS